MFPTSRALAAAAAARRRLAQPAALRPLQRQQQRRWAAVHDVRFLATTQAPSRSVTEKYREQLERKAREEGHGGVAELKEAYKDKIHQYRRSDGVESVPGLDALLSDAEPPRGATATAAASSQSKTTTTTTTAASPDGLTQPPPPPPPTPSQSQSESTPTPAKNKNKNAAIKPLSEILDLSKARALPEKELSAIWRLRHAHKPTSLCAVIPSTTYAHLELTARKHPIFVLPVPRGADVGAEIHFLQWVFDAESGTATVLFTQLAEYKARGEWAQPHTSVTHYFDRDIARDQGVVLMAGSLVEGRGASLDDAKWLLMLMQRFYGGEGAGGTGVDGAKRELLEAFGKGDSRFTVEKLLEESERLG
ncbi:ATP11 protein-domain-containing protein [Microdochium trichocladiopsis]|uniref:ATP11 protein-domain-containing protein n=1 Tax=Microdochium trichocladiopsis TaxID=1682393 RepID=A0A9P8YC80_9PEZI|nr:ATP11 protein-domain-containing protein [Microdochium trichocladiopsis]KAH7035379.1 ATP11 protein-domain-containing protein [Microdochium trichocladiopsis]